MRSISAIFLSNTLCAILDHVEQTPDVAPDLPGLLEFKETLIRRIQELQREDPLRFPGAHPKAV